MTGLHRQRPVKKRLIGFSSIGAPNLSPEECASFAAASGMDFIELRARPGFNVSPVARLALPVRVIGTSFRLITATEKDFTDLEECARLAAILNAPYLLVFGGKKWGDPLSEADFKNAAAVLGMCRRIVKKHSASCEILLETHSAFSSSERCLKLSGMLEEPVSILWDSHHTWHFAGESLGQTWSDLGPFVRHIHYKDSVNEVGAKEGIRYTLPGEGEFPHGELFRQLENADYKGGLSLEWEKMWHSELPEFPQALEMFVHILQEDENRSDQLASAGFAKR